MTLPPLVPPGPEPFGVDALRRYARHLVLPDLGPEGQRRLRAARVLCVGAGGLGSPVLLYLAAAGIGTIGVVDDDTVEVSNLQRQVVHRQQDLGRSKARSAADAIRAVNPLVDVRVHEQRLTAATALDLLSGYDVVVDGSDNFPTRYLVNDTCVLLGVPCVWGSVLRFDGQAAVFWAAYGPCYRCLHPQPPPPDSVPSCAEGGILGVVCGVIGSVQATEVVKLVAGIGEPLVGRLLIYDALTMDARTVRVRKDPDCPVCGPRPSIRSPQESAAADPGVARGDPGQGAVGPVSGPGITVERLAQRLAAREQGGDDFVLVDVREPAEAAELVIPGSVLVPPGALLAGDPTVLDQLPRDRPVILYCTVGRRSAQAADVLQRNGFTQVLHLTGGLLAWMGHGWYRE